MPSILRRVVSGLTPRSRNPRSEETVARPRRDEILDIDHLQEEAERYRSEARDAATDDQRTYLASMAAARPHMIATLDTFRDTLENLGGGIGVTDPVSGEVVLELSP